MAIPPRYTLPVPAGAGKPLALLIPGLDGTGRFFEPHLEALSARFRPVPWKFRCRTPFNFTDLTEELGEATAGESPNSITVVGESFGGAVALHYVLAYPARVRLLGLVNTFCYYPRRIRIRLGCRLAPLLHWYGIRSLKNLVAERILALEGIPLEGRRLYHEIVTQVDQEAYRRRLELVRDVDLRGHLSEISVPTLVFASRRDKIVPSVQAGRYLADHIPNSRFYEFPEKGHALLLTPGFSLADYLSATDWCSELSSVISQSLAVAALKDRILKQERGSFMGDLTDQKCEACRIGAPKVTENEIAELKPQVPDWQLTTRDNILRLERSFEFKDFAAALAFANQVGSLAEDEGHHPAILVEWGRVTVSWWTHKIHGLHRNDFIMAAKTDRIPHGE